MTQHQLSPGQVLEALKQERPKFHGRQQAGTKNYAIQWSVLEWMVTNLRGGGASFETGCGYSTVVLACLSRKHTVVSPFSEEHEVLVEWCTKHGIATAHLEFVARPSQEVVPGFEPGELDFVLIDGDHAFPAPFIDWYYTADKLRVGGVVAVDDTQIPTGKILRDFLVQEVDRWNMMAEIGKTALFERTSEEAVAKGVFWTQQPYCEIPSDGDA